MLTIQDIANMAGVTKSTVSRYLNGGSVSKKTAAKIEQIVTRENYQPSPFARSLKAKDSPIIGVIVPRFDSSATNHTLAGIDQLAKEEGYQLLIANANQEEAGEIAAIKQFASYKVAGILLIASKVTEGHHKALSRAGVPCVIIGQRHPDFHCVIHDDYQAGYDLAKALIGQGFAHLTYIGVSSEDKAVGIDRKQGVLDGAQEAGARIVETLETSFSAKDAEELGSHLLRTQDRCLIIAATDNLAVGLMKAAHDLGKSLPDQVAIAGFGGYEIGTFVHPSLTTVVYDFERAGKTALQILLQLQKGLPCPKETVLPVSLLLRGSTARKNGSMTNDVDAS